MLEPDACADARTLARAPNGPKAGADLTQLSAPQHSRDEASFPRPQDREMLYDHLLEPEACADARTLA